MTDTDQGILATSPQQICSSARGYVFYTPRDPRGPLAAPATLPSPHIQPRPRRPHSIHIVSYPSGFIPPELRPLLDATRLPEPPEAIDWKDKGRDSQRRGGTRPRSKLFEKLLAVWSVKHKSQASFSSDSAEAPPRPRPSPAPRTRRPRPLSLISLPSRLSRIGQAAEEAGTMARPLSMIDHVRPSLVSGSISGGYSHRNSMIAVRPAKSLVSSSVSEVAKPLATGSGVSCSINLAEPNIFLTGFEHDGHHHRENSNTTALLRGRLVLELSKNIKIKSIVLKLTGRARTEWPEGIPPLKVELFEETTLRTQSLVFFHAMHENIWETEFGNQCTFKLKGANQPGSKLTTPLGANSSVTSLQAAGRQRQSIGSTTRDLRRLSLQNVNSRSAGKGDQPANNPVQTKGYKVFYPGVYEYSFELPIDHHQLETIKLHYGFVKWELETTVERAGAFKPNLHGTKEVSIVRVPDQMSLEMTEPISISRQWEDQLHYDIMISGKSFPIGSKIPIAFKLTPLAKVQVHKLKVFVTESVEYWTNDRRVTRKDPGRKILLLEKTAGQPLDKRFENSDLRVLSGGELSPAEREEARQTATRRRLMHAARVNGVPQPLPAPSENILGDLDLGLETYWASTEMEMNVQIPTCEMMARDRAMRLYPDCSWKNVSVFHWIKIVMRISRLDPEDPAGKRRRHFEISIDSPFTVLNCRATQANTALPQYCPGLGADSRRQQMMCGCSDSLPSLPSPTPSTANLTTAESGQAQVQVNCAVSTNNPAVSVLASDLPTAPRAAHLHLDDSIQRVTARSGMTPTVQPPSQASQHPASPLQRVRDQGGLRSGPNPHLAPYPHRPIELLRYPSYNPPAFDADEPPPPLAFMTPPPQYDVIVGTPSVDGLADYFVRLADYEDPAHQNEQEGGLGIRDVSVGDAEPDEELASTPSASAAGPAAGGDYLAAHGVETEAEEDEASSPDESDEDGGPTRIHSGGRVHVANPRSPGGRSVPSRSLDLERPVFNISMAGVVRRGEQRI